MLALELPAPTERPFRLLAVGAHPDDIEIGAGGTLLRLAQDRPGIEARYVVLTGTDERRREAEDAARSFLSSAKLTLDLLDLPEGRLPVAWSDVKDALEAVAGSDKPDLIIAPSRLDAHQDHRTIGEIIPTVFRDTLVFSYEIPKWDGDLHQPSCYIPLTSQIAHSKVDLLHKCYPSQQHRDWWDNEVFLGLARIRGMECRAQYAEAFHCTKAVVTL
jgi:LmbE family N-acetylglucosaminyl deacetylase